MDPPGSIVTESCSRKGGVLPSSDRRTNCKWPTGNCSFVADGSAAGVEVVEVEHGIEDQEITAHGFAAPHRVVGKENDVTFAVRNIHDGRLFGDFVAACNHAAEEQIFFGSEAEDHSRLLVLRRNRKAGKVREIFGNVEFLLMRCAFDGFFGRLVGAGLDDIRIAGGAASTGARGTSGAFLGPGAAEIAADGNASALAKIDVELKIGRAHV